MRVRAYKLCIEMKEVERGRIEIKKRDKELLSEMKEYINHVLIVVIFPLLCFK